MEQQAYQHRDQNQHNQDVWWVCCCILVRLGHWGRKTKIYCWRLKLSATGVSCTFTGIRRSQTWRWEDELETRGTLYNSSWRGSSACLDISAGWRTSDWWRVWCLGSWRDVHGEEDRDDIKEWCQMDIHSLSRMAQDRARWKWSVRRALGTNGRKPMEWWMDGWTEIFFFFLRNMSITFLQMWKNSTLLPLFCYFNKLLKVEMWIFLEIPTYSFLMRSTV